MTAIPPAAVIKAFKELRLFISDVRIKNEINTGYANYNLRDDEIMHKHLLVDMNIL